MKKKQILATLVMLSLMQGSAYAAFNYVVTEDTEWPYVLGQAYEGNPQGNRTLHAGDTLTIKNNAKVYLDYEKTTFYYGIPFINSYDYDQKVGGYIAGDVAITGGNIEIIGPAKQINYAIYNNEEYYSNIKLDNTNITIKDFKYGIKGENGTTSIVCNQYTKFDSVDYGIATKNNAKVNITSKEVSFNDGMGAIYASGESAVTIDNTNVEDSKVKIIDHYIGIDALENAEVNITTNDFTFKNSMPVNFKVTAINSAGTSKVNVKAANTQFYGNVAAQENGSINFLKDSNIDSQLVAIYSNKADAVSAQSDTGEAKINFETNSYINSQGDEIYHADRQGVRTVSAIRANRNSIITLDNAVGIYGDIIAGRGISDSDAKGGQITINSVDYADFKGDVLAGNSGKIDITLNNKANYEGRVDDYFQASLNNVFRPDEFYDEDGNNINVEEAGHIALTLNDSQWTARGQNFVADLTLNNGIVDMTGDIQSSVTVNNLSGNGTIKMNLDAENRENGDMLYVVGNHSGEQTIVVNWLNENGVNAIADSERIRFATTGGNASTFKAQTRDAGFFNVAYLTDTEPYDTVNETEENLDYNGATIEGADNGTDKPGNEFVNETFGNGGINHYIVGIDESQNEVSDAGKTIINMSKVNYNNAIYMDRLNKRLGETRYINPEEEQGMWVRIRHDRIGKKDAFRSQNTMYEMGYDVKQDCDNGERRVGFAIDYMDGKAEYTGIAGDGDVKRYGLWLYDTWLGDKGHYADYVAKWGHLENDFDIMARSTGEKITGDYSNNVFSISAEYGKKNDMGNNWYFEPQAQLQLARVTGADYVTTQGTKVSLDGINSLIGRAGFRLGRDVDERSTVYIKADLLHEFLGEQNMHVEDNTFNGGQTFENKGTWYDIGFGFATAMGKNSYAFMDFEKSFGNDNDETYQISAGVQWTF